MRDLLNVVRCQYLEILHCVQDDEPVKRHPECNEGFHEHGIVPALEDAALRSE